MNKNLPLFETWQVPQHWRVVDFISDLHLHASELATFSAWSHYMATTPADAVVILGDLFEVWIGDDSLHASAVSLDVASTSEMRQTAGEALFERRCVDVLKQASKRLTVAVMCGNRDFLIGPAFGLACNARMLHDPTRLEAGGVRVLLMHGDALCLDDTDYMAFRARVRSEGWQRGFLSNTIDERRAVARELRAQSEARKKSGKAFGDLDSTAVDEWLEAADCAVMVHGHTHKPATHPLAHNRQRMVLSDWDLDAAPARGEVLRLFPGNHNQSARWERLPLSADLPR